MVFRQEQGTMPTSKEYRGRDEIITQILQAVGDSGIEGIPRTLIMYRVFLSYFQLKEYLSILIENGLIEKFHKPINDTSNGNGNDNEKVLYKITEKGLRFLHISQEIENLIGTNWEHKDTSIQTNAISKL
jgi:predicted transcriptional regulator